MFININDIFIIYKTFEFVYNLIVIIIYCDNEKAQIFAKNFINHFRMKYINIQHYFVREKIVEKRIQLKYVFIQNQIIDNLIKLLSKNAFKKFRNAFDFT